MNMKALIAAVFAAVMLVGCGAYSPMKGDMSAPLYHDNNFDTPNWHEQPFG